MNKTITTTIIAFALTLGALAAETAKNNGYSLDIKAPISRSDAGIPLGNGLMGGLLWGAADTVNISLDRGDLWDLREHPSYVATGFNYAKVVEMAQARKAGELNRRYSRRSDYPTKLPGARLVLTLPSGQQVRSFHLDAKTGQGGVVLGAGKLEGFFSQTQPVALFKISGNRPAFKFATATALSQLGYALGQPQHDADSAWVVQSAAKGLSYAIYARAKACAGETLLAVTIATSREAADPLALAKQQVTTALETGYEKLFAENQAWWNEFWSKSSVSIPDAQIQHQYNMVQYFYGAASKPGAPPIPLQGLWSTDNGEKLPPWHGDYHHDLNTQLTYWTYLTSGRFAQGQSFVDFMWSLKPVQEKWAKSFWGVDGFVVPGVMSQDGKPMGSWFQYTLSPTMGAWVAQSFYLHWRYTMDAEFLRDRAYPYCQGIADALTGLLRPDANGKLKLPLSSSPEIHGNSQAAWLKPNSNCDLSLLRWLFDANAEMATALGKDAEARRWTELLGKLDDFAVDKEDGKLLIAPGEALQQAHRHFSHLMPIHPMGNVNIDGGERQQRIIKASLAQIEELGPKNWCGYSFGWISCIYARAGQGDSALRYLSRYMNTYTFKNGFHSNTPGQKTFTLEGNFAAGQAVHEMLLQSWGGKVRVFPSVPAQWANASFDKLRAEGGFIVSAERKNGGTQRVSITANVDGLLTLKNPFGNTSYQSSVPVKVTGDCLTCPMKKGQVLELHR